MRRMFGTTAAFGKVRVELYNAGSLAGIRARSESTVSIRLYALQIYVTCYITGRIAIGKSHGLGGGISRSRSGVQSDRGIELPDGCIAHCAHPLTWTQRRLPHRRRSHHRPHRRPLHRLRLHHLHSHSYRYHHHWCTAATSPSRDCRWVGIACRCSDAEASHIKLSGSVQGMRSAFDYVFV